MQLTESLNSSIESKVSSLSEPLNLNPGSETGSIADMPAAGSFSGDDICSRLSNCCGQFWDSICRRRQKITINGHQIEVLDKIAEGAFSFVYRVRDCVDGKHYALKKVITQTPEQEDAAQWEIKVHNEFNHPSLLQLQGFSIDEGKVAHSQTVSLLFPLFVKGSLEDELQQRRPSGRFLSERVAIDLFSKICEGVQQFHHHSPPWAHRDIKPGNILIHENGSPVLMDFGSAAVARSNPHTRAQALQIQEWCEENCSMPYRAVELFDVKTSSTITESTDVWSLGCTLYALAFGYSPFECAFLDSGAIRVERCSYLRVINGPTFPPQHLYSTQFIKLIKKMLNPVPSARPSIDWLCTETKAWVHNGKKSMPTRLHHQVASNV